MTRVVVSITTMPDRYDKLIHCLQSLRNQDYPIDALYLSLPHKSRRLNIDYPELPEEIAKLCTVVRCEDYGPITKITGALLKESKPDTVIITFDDDIVYPSGMISAMLEKHKQYPESALGSSGISVKNNFPLSAIAHNENYWIYRVIKFTIPEEGRRVDSIQGYAGALYMRKFFPAKDRLEEDFYKYALLDDNLFLNDDIVISGYLSMKDVERRIFSDLPEVSFVLEDNGEHKLKNTELSASSQFFTKLNTAVAKAKSLGMFASTEPFDTSETVVGKGVIIVLSIIILIAVIIYLIVKNNPNITL